MVTFYTNKATILELQAWMVSEPGIEELVAIIDILSERPIPHNMNFLVRDRKIIPIIDWYNSAPPYLLPNVELNQPNFLGLIFAKYGALEKARQYLQHENPTLWRDLIIMDRLLTGLVVLPEQLVSDYSEYDEFRLMHNQAIIHHYAAPEGIFDPKRVRYFYEEALNAAPNDEYRAYTLARYAGFLADFGDFKVAEPLLAAGIEKALTEEAKLELKKELATIWMHQLSVPYDQDLLEKLKTTISEVVANLTQQGRELEMGICLIDAAQVATISESFSEALGYLSKAADIFRANSSEELYANAQYRRGLVLYTWAQHDQPQFFRPAAESFQEALKIYTKTDAPSVFAEIQQYLGIIYSEIPADAKKKSIWAAVSSSAFQEALHFFTREEYPYEFAKICNHYGNALNKYPAALHTDNHEKALFYYGQALEIRTASAYPLERAMTLLNYL
ncbi:MAG: hypothetical protein AAFU67_01570, partial [Bacteroidota bacterium]